MDSFWCDVNQCNGVQKIICAYKCIKNSSGDEIANVNFHAVRPEATQIR